MNKTANQKKIEWALSALASFLFMTLLFFTPIGHASQNLTETISAFDIPLLQSQVLRLSLDSLSMGFKVPFMVYLPKGYGGGDAYPVWYGLHGYSSSESMWLNAGAGRAADEIIENSGIRPMIMVFPLTRYDPAKVIEEDMKDGKRDASQMEQFLCGELIPYIDAHFNTLQSPKGRSIGGFSMGGYFALEIAFRHPDLFGKVGAYSPALMYSDYSGGQLEKWLYPGSEPEDYADVADFAKAKGFDGLKVYLDCGKVNDPFSVGAQSLYKALDDLKINVLFDMHDGGHTLLLDKMTDYILIYGDEEHVVGQ